MPKKKWNVDANSGAGFERDHDTASKMPFRKFLGEDGSRRLWLPNEETRTLLGKTVWSHTKAEVKIGQEVTD